MRSRLTAASLGAYVLCLSACNAPPVPPEAEKAIRQEAALRRAGAPFFTPQLFEDYRLALEAAKEQFFKQKAKLVWLRKYDRVQQAFVEVLAYGEVILERVAGEKQSRAELADSRLTAFRLRTAALRDITALLREGSFLRLVLMRAELLTVEADRLLEKDRFAQAEEKLTPIEDLLKETEGFVFSLLSRFQEEDSLSEWREWAGEAVSESRKQGSCALVVSKLERTLILYVGGEPVLTCSIGLGRNGLADKKHGGDYATPEGKYRVTKKITDSRFYKALLIDYPNLQDRERFKRNQASGLVPSGAGIGGLIEIHGGGDDVITDGCIALQNSDMDKIFSVISVGTPVTIVGTLRRLEEVMASGTGTIED